MKNFSYNKLWIHRAVQIHTDTIPIPLIKSKPDMKTDKDYVDIKLHINLTPKKSFIYKLIMTLFDNVDPEEFLLFQQNCNMTLDTSGTLRAGEKFNICSLCYGAKRYVSLKLYVFRLET